MLTSNHLGGANQRQAIKTLSEIFRLACPERHFPGAEEIKDLSVDHAIERYWKIMKELQERLAWFRSAQVWGWLKVFGAAPG
jgi:hypothetical protein